jgi:hypothetical protein
MIRRTCAACGRPINRTDRLFEASDGNCCQACLKHLGRDASRREVGKACPPPVWTCLPPLGPLAHGAF